VSTTAAALPADLEAGLRRLKLATVRRLAPELFQDARSQRWAPEDLLRALVEAEVAARDASMAAARLKAAGFPVRKSFQEFDFSASSIPRPTLDYLASLEWVRAQENPCLVGPPGPG
jgi:DNA replication protein DnaC